MCIILAFFKKIATSLIFAPELSYLHHYRKLLRPSQFIIITSLKGFILTIAHIKLLLLDFCALYPKLGEIFAKFKRLFSTKQSSLKHDLNSARSTRLALILLPLNLMEFKNQEPRAFIISLSPKHIFPSLNIDISYIELGPKSFVLISCVIQFIIPSRLSS